jgi:hypothetical protein
MLLLLFTLCVVTSVHRHLIPRLGKSLSFRLFRQFCHLVWSNLLWHVDTLLGNYSEISSYTTAVAS